MDEKVIWGFFKLLDDKECGMGILTSIRSPWVTWDSLGRT